MNVNLTTELLRHFVAIVDTGSMSKAAQEICVTQSALSLQMKRLSDLVGVPIFHRHHRGMTLTTSGRTLLDYSRLMIELNDRAIASLSGEDVSEPIRIAMIQDFADLVLSKTLLRIARINRAATVQVRVGSSLELVGQLAGGLHDIVLCLGDADDPSAVTSGTMAWLGNPSLAIEPRLPIALMEKPCIFRDAAIAALEASGREYKIVLETPSMSVLRAAVHGGLALTCRTPSLFGGGLLPLEEVDLALPRVAYCLRTNVSANATVLRVAQILRHALIGLRGVAAVPMANARSGFACNEPAFAV